MLGFVNSFKLLILKCQNKIMTYFDVKHEQIISSSLFLVLYCQWRREPGVPWLIDTMGSSLKSYQSKLVKQGGGRDAIVLCQSCGFLVLRETTGSQPLGRGGRLSGGILSANDKLREVGDLRGNPRNLWKGIPGIFPLKSLTKFWVHMDKQSTDNIPMSVFQGGVGTQILWRLGVGGGTT